MDILEAFVGFVSGALSGMGVGGGSILLVYLTAFAGFEQIGAQGINLIFFLATSPVAIFGHIKNRFIKWKKAAFSVLFGIPGVYIGFYIANRIDKTLLKAAFALLLLFVGIRELVRKESA